MQSLRFTATEPVCSRAVGPVLTDTRTSKFGPLLAPINAGRSLSAETVMNRGPSGYPTLGIVQTTVRSTRRDATDPEWEAKPAVP